jgi:hypothetical protein
VMCVQVATEVINFVRSTVLAFTPMALTFTPMAVIAALKFCTGSQDKANYLVKVND